MQRSMLFLSRQAQLAVRPSHAQRPEVILETAVLENAQQVFDNWSGNKSSESGSCHHTSSSSDDESWAACSECSDDDEELFRLLMAEE
mmetsp:Transcript_29950/g.54556  ORF Transcript_29950/g.54556 Transcript_29950/m.54556 type:complete len:88 (+) Transcript_29950:85-348(+)